MDVKALKYYAVALFWTILGLFSGSVQAQIPTTQGLEFWLTFLKNETTPTTSLIISAKNGATGTVSNPRTGWSTTFTVAAHGRTDVSIPASACYMSTEGVSNMGILVQASDTISVYASNFQSATFDATNVLPVEALGDEHLIQMYASCFYGSCIGVVATSDNTVIDITPTAQTQSHSANVPFSITLNRGESFQLLSSSATGDMSGTTVVARDCKKIAVFSGNVCTQVPYGCAYCDHIVEQTWPTWSWGKEFIVTSTLMRSFDQVRITASVNNTHIYNNGALVSTLQAGSHFEYRLQSGQTSYIVADNPVCTYLYLAGYDCAGTQGDPSMVWISPVEQRIQEVTFGTFNGSSLTQYVNIVAPTAGITSMTLDGANIANDFTQITGNTAYSYARKNITHGTHTLYCDSGFIAHVYGLGHCESYAYSVGSSAANLKAQMFVNDVSSVDISAFQEYCFGDTIDFRAFVQTDYDAIAWEFGDGTTGAGEVCPHLYPTYGVYNVNMIVDRRSSSNSCGGFDTISSIVRILQNDTTITEYVCYGFDYDTNGFHIPFCQSDTFITHTYASVWGCDSVVHLDLHVFPIDPITIPVSICQGEFYLENDFQIIGQEVGTHSYTHQGMSAAGCDSVTVLQVTVLPNPEPYLAERKIVCSPNEFPVLLNPGSFTSYRWNTGSTSAILSVSEPGTYTVTVSNEDGCTASSAIAVELHDVTAKITQDVDFCDDLTATLHVETEAPEVEWNTGDITRDLVIYQHGHYTVTASNEFCETMTAITIEECPFSLYLPNTITPWLSDGKNDYFYLSGDLDYILSMEINIYDRWGKLAYRSTDKNFRWDGKVDGKWIPNNTFTYKLNVTTILNKKFVYKGHVNVL